MPVSFDMYCIVFSFSFPHSPFPSRTIPHPHCCCPNWYLLLLCGPLLWPPSPLFPPPLPPPHYLFYYYPPPPTWFDMHLQNTHTHTPLPPSPHHTPPSHTPACTLPLSFTHTHISSTFSRAGVVWVNLDFTPSWWWDSGGIHSVVVAPHTPPFCDSFLSPHFPHTPHFCTCLAFPLFTFPSQCVHQTDKVERTGGDVTLFSLPHLPPLHPSMTFSFFQTLLWWREWWAGNKPPSTPWW